MSTEQVVNGHRCAVVQLTYNLETCQLKIGGVCPTPELAKAICLMAADETERRIVDNRRAEESGRLLKSIMELLRVP